MPTILVTGPDGVGKSTTGLELEAEFKRRGIKARYRHIKRGRKPFTAPKVKPHALLRECCDPTSDNRLIIMLLLRLRLFIRFTFILIIYTAYSLFSHARGQIFISDRNPLIMCYCRFHCCFYSDFHKKLSRLVPTPTRTYLLEATPTTIIKRKKGLDKSQIAALILFEKQIAEDLKMPFCQINTEMSPTEIAVNISNDFEGLIV